MTTATIEPAGGIVWACFKRDGLRYRLPFSREILAKAWLWRRGYRVAGSKMFSTMALAPNDAYRSKGDTWQ